MSIVVVRMFAFYAVLCFEVVYIIVRHKKTRMLENVLLSEHLHCMSEKFPCCELLLAIMEKVKIQPVL